MTSNSDETIRLGERLGGALGDGRSLGRDLARADGGALLALARGGSCAIAAGAAVIAGRDPACELAIDDGSLSRRHARFSCGPAAVGAPAQGGAGGLVVEDLGSTNGTEVNGVRLPPRTAHALAAGDELRLGDVRMTVVLTSGARVRTPLVSHERFVEALADELERARLFGRSCALAVLRPSAGRAAALVPQALARLRAVDRVALYGDDVLEVLLAETDGDAATAWVRAVLTSSPAPAASGVAAFPADATTADAVVEAALAALDPAPLAPHAPTRDVRRAPGRARQVVTDAVGDGIVASSPAMRALLATIDKVAKTAIPVLLVGETGSGKEVCARLIHERSPRAARPMVAVNCGAIAPTLVESTLFGHEKGAFTGATDARPGVFEAAHGGTVFLDEIGELPAAAQVALLRVLEARTVTRVGATQERAIDVRVVAATHRDLDEMVARGAFRQDLLYRLNAITVAVPPLRERREEMDALAQRFLAEANRRHGRRVRGFVDDARDALLAHHWPGNVRELKNAVERAVVIAAADLVELDDLPESLRALGGAAGGAATPAGAAGVSLGEALEQREVELILEALTRNGQSVADAAVALQMPKRTLQHRMKLLGITRKAGYAK